MIKQNMASYIVRILCNNLIKWTPQIPMIPIGAVQVCVGVWLLHWQKMLLVRLSRVVQGIAVEECEAVFKEWSDRNGVIY